MKLTSTLGVTDTFVQAHAAVLLEWEGIEHHLLVIFSALVRASPEVSSTDFHRATTLKTRLTMIDAAARVFLKDGDLYLEWRALSYRVGAEAKHSGLALFASVQNADDPGKEISPPFESTGHEVAANPNDVYDLRHMRQWRDGFRCLAADLHGFLARVENALAIAGAPPPLSEV